MLKQPFSSRRRIICRLDGNKIMINAFKSWKRNDEHIGKGNISMIAFAKMIRKAIHSRVPVVPFRAPIGASAEGPGACPRGNSPFYFVVILISRPSTTSDSILFGLILHSFLICCFKSFSSRRNPSLIPFLLWTDFPFNVKS